MNPTTSLLDRAHLDRDQVRHEVARGLDGADDGELFLEYSQIEALMFDNCRLKQATYDTSQGFGLRAVKDDAVGYAHSSDVSLAALIRAADAVHAVRGGYSGSFASAPAHSNVRLYGDENPLDAPGFESKVKLLAEIDAYVRDREPRVRQVTVSLGATWQVVEILRPDGESYRDIRPLVRVNVTVVAGQGDRQESGSKGYGGREGYARFIETKAWRDAADGAIREAMVNLQSVPAPAGEMDVVLGSGWPGVMLHEAVGHGLEGDFNRKQTAAFARTEKERCGPATARRTSIGLPWSATSSRSIRASAPAARTARACRSESGSRRCGWSASPWEERAREHRQPNIRDKIVELARAG